MYMKEQFFHSSILYLSSAIIHVDVQGMDIALPGCYPGWLLYRNVQLTEMLQDRGGFMNPTLV